MESSKIMMFPEMGNNSIDPNLLMALNNNGGFGGNNWISETETTDSSLTRLQTTQVVSSL